MLYYIVNIVLIQKHQIMQPTIHKFEPVKLNCKGYGILAFPTFNDFLSVEIDFPKMVNF